MALYHGTITPFLLAPCKDLQAFESITEEVYGHYTPGQPWRPRPYEEEKG